MKRFKMLLGMGILLAASMALATRAEAQPSVPNFINFQGQLDSAGAPIPDGTHSVNFSIWTLRPLGGGTSLWNEDATPTTSGGLFTHPLGSVTSLPATLFATNDSLFLQIRVGPEVLDPRTALTSVGYARRVQSINRATGGTIYGDVDIQSNLTVSDSVGIGTTSPFDRLHIQGNSPYIRLFDTGVIGSASGLRLIHGSGTSIWSLGTSLAGATGSFSIRDDAAAAARLHIHTDGNVGIGTTSPAGRLGILNDAGFEIYGQGASAATPLNIFSESNMFLLAGTGRSLFFGSNNVNQQMALENGNVGIGTTGPTARLHLSNTDAAGAGLKLTNPTPITGKTWHLNSGDDGKFKIAQSGVLDALTILPSSGNVGIGTTSPGEKLEVAGNVKIGNATIRSGTGSPEGAVTGNVGNLFLRTDGGAGTTLYVKESGNGTNTGWAAK